MTKRLTLRTTQEGDVTKVLSGLSREDKREFEAIGLDNSPSFVEASILMTTKRCFTVVSPTGVPLVVFGVSSDTADPSVGVIFALPGRGARRHWRFFVRHTERFLAMLSQGYLVLSNWKDARNTTHIAWLRRCGFTFIKSDPDYRGSGHQFLQFVRPTR